MKPATTSANRLALIAAAVLSTAVAAVHVQDQGSVTAFTDPDWLGWAYRLLEVSAVVTAGVLVFAAGAGLTAARARLAWATTALIGLGPLVGYLLSRTSGLPGDSDDIGNWAETLGTVSLVVEGLLLGLAVTAMVLLRTAPAATASDAARHPVLVH